MGKSFIQQFVMNHILDKLKFDQMMAPHDNLKDYPSGYT